MLETVLKTFMTRPATIQGPSPRDQEILELGERLRTATQRRLGRSLQIREVDVGSCNACELEIHALNNPIYDLSRFGIGFVASPRHADVLMVTGPVSTNMREALVKTYEATPDPKWVIAVGDCGINCGAFAGSYGVVPGSVGAVIPVDLAIPGCPPRPMDMLKGLLALVEASAAPAVKKRNAS
ncbi:MAG: NADH-quinone oxidoreductase subunit NuoB [Alphaproteobacteria bacterium]|nr:MAG: NADH-quinone oxidoreductase subunit NuoB [Alphaproteobacteria bacterium]